MSTSLTHIMTVKFSTMEGIPEGNLEEGAMETVSTSSLPATDVDRRLSPRIQVGEESGNASVGHLSPRGAQQPLMWVPTRLTPVHRPLTTHTPLGSPIHGSRIRSNSLGSSVGPFLPGCAAAAYSPTAPVMSAYSTRMSTLANPPPSPLLTSHGTNHDHDPAALQLPQIPPPEPTEVQRVMEAAAAKERARAKSCEEEEANLGPDELRSVLKRERHRSARMAADLAALRASAVQSQFEAEVLEEGRINNLMRRLDVLQQEKGRIIVELEREEEMLTNTLQRKLNQVKEEKAVLERQIEREKKAHLVLQSQLSDLRNQHLSVAEALEEEDEMEEED